MKADQLENVQSSLAKLREQRRTAKRDGAPAGELKVLDLDIAAYEAQERAIIARRQLKAPALVELIAELASTSGRVEFGESRAVVDRLKGLGADVWSATYLPDGKGALSGHRIFRASLELHGVTFRAQYDRPATPEELDEQRAREAAQKAARDRTLDASSLETERDASRSQGDAADEPQGGEA